MVPASESRWQVKGELRAAEALNQTNATHLKGLEAAQGLCVRLNKKQDRSKFFWTSQVQLMTAREALAEAGTKSSDLSWVLLPDENLQ